MALPKKALAALTLPISASNCAGDVYKRQMYAEPDLTPGERNAVWAKLESEYRPWLDFAGDVYKRQRL